MDTILDLIKATDFDKTKEELTFRKERLTKELAKVDKQITAIEALETIKNA